MEIKGKIAKILDAQSGKSAKGEWKKQEFILETNAQYPKKVCIANWNDKIDLASLKLGDEVVAHIDVESREFNGKWYTDVKIWKLEMAGQQQSGQPDMPEKLDDIQWNNNNDAPFDDDAPF
ncbi:MAG: DUF3127 domain-containing protein [Bacteroidales bacterium]|nr:DUF3127 domain-containing protein [Bacteroidales bacterium]